MYLDGGESHDDGASDDAHRFKPRPADWEAGVRSVNLSMQRDRLKPSSQAFQQISDICLWVGDTFTCRVFFSCLPKQAAEEGKEHLHPKDSPGIRLVLHAV